MANKTSKVYQFKITLMGIEPEIWRRIQVPEDYTFWDFHIAIQDAMGWLDIHLHQFDMIDPKSKQDVTIGMLDLMTGLLAEEGDIPEYEAKIADYFSLSNTEAYYEYDFGDSWEHSIILEKILPAEANTQYPRCIAGQRACPPEDCGGVEGYEELLEIIADPSHPEYESVKEQYDEAIEPEAFDLSWIHFDNPKERWEYLYGPETPE